MDTLDKKCRCIMHDLWLEDDRDGNNERAFGKNMKI